MNEKKTLRLNFGDKECLIAPYEYSVTPEVLQHYKKLELSPSETAQMSQLVQLISSTMETGDSNPSFYSVKWPNGMPNMLTPFTDGSGYMGALLNETGKIAAQSRLLPLNPYLLIRAGFSLLALISQIFLWSVHQKLNVINQKLDEILEFLYGDKKAELLAAISFTRYAYENFSSIMEHEGQRNATIQSLQSARMTAMQDVEFYLSDLHSRVSVADGKEFPYKAQEMGRITSKAIQSADCLDLSIQLCMTANLLEIYYSQNYDPKYLKYVKNDVGNYISRCEKQMIGDFNALKANLDVQERKKADWDKEKEQVRNLIQQVEQRLAPLMNDKGNELKAKLATALRFLNKETECCIGADGATYLKSEN